MKVFPFTPFRDLCQLCKDTDYKNVQNCEKFKKESLSDDQIIDDIISNDPEKSNKVCNKYLRTSRRVAQQIFQDPFSRQKTSQHG